MAKINEVVTARTVQEVEHMPKVRVTLADINETKRQHIKQNLLYTPEEAGQILCKSARTILDLVKDGKLIAADGNVKTGKNGLKGSPGMSITAESLEAYRQSIIIPPEKWAE